MSLKDIFLEVFKDKKVYDKYTKKQILDMVQTAAKTKGENYQEGSILPSDYCYNRSNAGIIFDSATHLFDLGDDDTYEYLGVNYNYKGKIVNISGDTKEKRDVGQWIDGKAVFTIKTVTSVWLGAAVLAFNKYYQQAKPSQNDMYFKQEEIAKMASHIHGGKVPPTLVSSQCSVSNLHTNYKYLVPGDVGREKLRRLSFPGEYEGKYEKPSLELDWTVRTDKGDIKVKDLVQFVDNEYTDLFNNSKRQNKNEETEKLLTEIKCISILDYLEKYAGKDYEDPEKAELSKKEKLLLIKTSGGSAVQELDKMARLCEIKYGLKRTGVNKWLTGGNNRVREYLWRQLKFSDHEGSPTSLSLFVEISEGRARFRFSVELNDAQSKKDDYDKHHRLLDKDIEEATDKLVYILGGNNSEFPMKELDLTTSEVKQKVGNGEYKKVQISRLITRDYIDSNSLDDYGILNVMLNSIEALIPYYKLAIGDTNPIEHRVPEKSRDDEEYKEMIEITYDKNIILYGPPGTGKTYNSINYAVAIIEQKSIELVTNENHSDVIERYNHYKQSGRVTFTTFHQSYGYEEFIEGIKPVMSDESETDSSDIQYVVKAGVFKEFCERALNPIVESENQYGINDNPTIWKVSLQGAGENALRRECFNNDSIRIGWDAYGSDITDEVDFKNGGQIILDNFINQIKIGDIFVTLFDSKTIDAVGVVQGEYEWLDDVEHYKRSRKVKWIICDIRENIIEINGGKSLTQSSVYPLRRFQMSDIKRILLSHNINLDTVVKDNNDNYVFIIDEINRGNISKIFGELITLIESTKRLGAKEAMTATLPYSPKPFGVPSNVYILGTMNTADRSIALMDTALRRRFEFVEMMPEIELLNDIQVEGIEIDKMLETINKRIEYLFDREHTIGHSYFLGLKDDQTLKKLSMIFRNSIIPLLQEYFYEDYSKIQLVLGDNGKVDEYKFIKDEVLKIKEVFKGKPDVDLPEKKYSIQNSAFDLKQSYILIYE